MSKQITLTVDGLKKFESDLEELKSVRRKEVAARIKQALEFGDLSENAEYDAAKNEQAEIEVNILKIENILKNAKVIDSDEIDTNVVSIGSKVKVKSLDNNTEVEYTIVGSTEANPFEKKISDESPVGASFIGRQIGDKIQVTVPAGELHFEILGISKI